ncbi:MAG: alpha/beta hydrolase [Lachnospiraceae bacterium]|nr:alpha/beta hydrolase [Lachnospiraceae bacterium]
MEYNSTEKIRKEFGKGDKVRDAGLTTPADVKRYDNIPYGEHGVWNLLDIYHEKDAKEKQPAIIIIHGGGWVYGTKEVYQFYGMGLAQRGFTVVNFNYRLAPEDPFPAMIEDINQLFVWVSEHAAAYKIDLGNLFVVGDSAGAQLASQYIAMLTNQAFSSLYDFQVPSDAIRIKAMALNCGIYDMRKCVKNSEQGDHIQAYFGEITEEKLELVNTMRYITDKFPPAFIMTSHCDFLKENAKPMLEFLTEKGIHSELKIYGSRERKDIAHVFHINMRLDESVQCNDDECNFFRKYIS